MQVTLADPIIEVTDWTPDLDALGEFVQRVRKTPADIKAEKDAWFARTGRVKKTVKPTYDETHTCISKKPGDDTVAYFLPGLWPRVKSTLDAQGRKYTIVDKRDPKKRPPLDMSAFAGVNFRERQDVAIATIASADCGIIGACTGFGKTVIISLLCKSYKNLNIVVVTHAVSVVETIYGYLKDTIPGEVGILGGGHDSSGGKRVVVSTFASLDHVPAEKVDLVLVDECHAVGNNNAAQQLMRFCWARRFGFSASPIRNDGTQLMMESLLGPVLMTLDYGTAADAGMVTPMKYLMLPCNNGIPGSGDPDKPDFLKKKLSYWCNKSRNVAIKQFVCDLKKSYDGQILIVCSTIRHCIQLHMLLPWFKVICSEGVDMAKLREYFPKERYPGLDLSAYRITAKQLAIAKNAFSKGTLRYVISTKIIKEGCNMPHLACLIRADGDVSDIENTQIPGRLSRLDDDKTWAYLVDVMDTFSEWALRRSIDRENFYKGQKWQKVTYQEAIDGLAEQSRKNG